MVLVSFPKDHVPAAGHQELLDQVLAGLLPEHLDMLRRRQRHQADQDKDWKERDWSWVQKGMCVGWAELFPQSKAWTFQHEGPPSSSMISIAPLLLVLVPTYFRIKRRGPDESERVLLGAVRYDLRTRRYRLESTAAGSSAQTVLPLTETLLKALPAIHDELSRRFSFMRGFADWLAQR
jgi:hypothetical protein